jgi:hypothetical protein
MDGLLSPNLSRPEDSNSRVNDRDSARRSNPSPLHLILSVLRRMKEFLMLASTRGMEDDSQEMDLTRVLEFHRHCRLILQDWGAAYEESLRSPPPAPHSGTPAPTRPLLPPRAKPEGPPGEQAQRPNDRSAVPGPRTENEAQKSVVKPPADKAAWKHEPSGAKRGRHQHGKQHAHSHTPRRPPT